MSATDMFNSNMLCSGHVVADMLHTCCIEVADMLRTCCFEARTETRAKITSHLLHLSGCLQVCVCVLSSVPRSCN